MPQLNHPETESSERRHYKSFGQQFFFFFKYFQANYDGYKIKPHIRAGQFSNMSARPYIQFYIHIRK